MVVTMPSEEEAEKYLKEQIDILSTKVTAKHKPFKDDDQVRLIVDFYNCLKKTRELSQKLDTKFGVTMRSKIITYMNK